MCVSELSTDSHSPCTDGGSVVSLRRKLTAIQNGAKDGSLRRIATVVKELSGEMEQTDAKLTRALAKIFGLASS